MTLATRPINGYLCVCGEPDGAHHFTTRSCEKSGCNGFTPAELPRPRNPHDHGVTALRDLWSVCPESCGPKKLARMAHGQNVHTRQKAANFAFNNKVVGYDALLREFGYRVPERQEKPVALRRLDT